MHTYAGSDRLQAAPVSKSRPTSPGTTTKTTIRQGQTLGFCLSNQCHSRFRPDFTLKSPGEHLPQRQSQVSIIHGVQRNVPVPDFERCRGSYEKSHPRFECRRSPFDPRGDRYGGQRPTGHAGCGSVPQKSYSSVNYAGNFPPRMRGWSFHPPPRRDRG